MGRGAGLSRNLDRSLGRCSGSVAQLGVGGPVLAQLGVGGPVLAQLWDNGYKQGRTSSGTSSSDAVLRRTTLIVSATSPTRP
ncbi:hypothetical protein [Streptomyces sp. Da 82-17]|uniref:hypothetical protein n=1 Tax=Streptomyces sp. Da 82-17 TaxID=3377116 RepID=UPI0038D4DDF7